MGYELRGKGGKRSGSNASASHAHTYLCAQTAIKLSGAYAAVERRTIHDLLSQCAQQTQAYARALRAQRLAVNRVARQQAQSRATRQRSNQP